MGISCLISHICGAIVGRKYFLFFHIHLFNIAKESQGGKAKTNAEAAQPIQSHAWITAPGILAMTMWSDKRSTSRTTLVSLGAFLGVTCACILQELFPAPSASSVELGEGMGAIQTLFCDKMMINMACLEGRELQE